MNVEVARSHSLPPGVLHPLPHCSSILYRLDTCMTCCLDCTQEDKSWEMLGVLRRPLCCSFSVCPSNTFGCVTKTGQYWTNCLWHSLWDFCISELYCRWSSVKGITNTRLCYLLLFFVTVPFLPAIKRLFSSCQRKSANLSFLWVANFFAILDLFPSVVDFAFCSSDPPHP